MANICTSERAKLSLTEKQICPEEEEEEEEMQILDFWPELNSCESQIGIKCRRRILSVRRC